VQVRVYAGVGIDQDGFGGESLGTVAGDGVTKLKPEFRPIGAEHYHPLAAAMFAVDH
jgi:hypothetical protein